MRRRGIIRGLCISFVALCAAAWIISYVWPITIDIGYGSSGTDYVRMPVSNGRIGFTHMDDVMIGAGISIRKWYILGWLDNVSRFHFLGFAWYYPHKFEWCVTVPLWFPTALAAVLLWFGWRRTVRRGGGFPVEPNAEAKPVSPSSHP